MYFFNLSLFTCLYLLVPSIRPLPIAPPSLLLHSGSRGCRSSLQRFWVKAKCIVDKSPQRSNCAWTQNVGCCLWQRCQFVINPSSESSWIGFNIPAKLSTIILGPTITVNSVSGRTSSKTAVPPRGLLGLVCFFLIAALPSVQKKKKKNFLKKNAKFWSNLTGFDQDLLIFQLA